MKISLLIGLTALLLMSKVVDAFSLRPIRQSIIVVKKTGRSLGVPLSYVAKRGKMLLAESSDDPKADGIEPKYLASLGVFLFACLYDFFITHQGFKDGWVP